MTKLSVNVNKVALLRNSRTIHMPSVQQATQVCIDAGCHGITVHPRPDERHITEQDVYDLSEMVTDVEYNIEGNPFVGPFMELVRAVQPTQATLVPDDPKARTSDHGWAVAAHAERLRPIVEELNALGIRVSLFIDPDPDEITHAARLNVDRIELYTEPYAKAYANDAFDEVLAQYARAAETTQAMGLGVNAGHDLNLENLPAFCAIPGILEVSIGHALTADALKMGLYAAVKAYLGKLPES
ncbi:MAG: pyridoxine 5'-phosphate synthase [Bacteroidetes bacterium]|nr:pyridoxine 5'-phosphate synthase [Bacteroidota bacterium]